jgi:hypothetical protein
MMRAEFEQANVVSKAAVISCPGLKHGLRIIFGLDFGENTAVSVVDEENDHLEALPRRGASQSHHPLPGRTDDRMRERAVMTPEQV